GAAVVERDRERHGAVVLRLLLRAFHLVQDAPRKPPVAAADELHLYVPRVHLVGPAAERVSLEVHQVADLAGRPLPVLGGEREHRQVLQASFERSLDDVEQRLLAAVVALRPRQAALLGPAAVAVHDDGDVSGHRRAVEVSQEAHGDEAGTASGRTATAGSGWRASRLKLRMRRSRWNSVNPYRIARASRRTSVGGVARPAWARSRRASWSSQWTAGQETRPASCSASAVHTTPPCPAANRSWGPGAPQTAHAPRRWWTPDRDSSFSRKASATAAGSGGASSRARIPDSSSRNRRTLRSCSSATLSTASSMVSPAAIRDRSVRSVRNELTISAWVTV